MSLFWFVAAAIVLGYRADADQDRQLDPGLRRQSQCRAGARRQRRPHQDRLFMLSAVMAAFAGIISSIRTSAANPNSGTGYELEVIAMVVIGGTALTGGRGTIIGTVLGIFILRVMRNGIVLIGVPGPRLQHLHRRDHPRHDGAALRARTPASGGDLSDGRRTHPHGEHQQVLRPRPGARGRQPDCRRQGDRRPARRQRRRQVDADQGAVRRGPGDQRRHLRPRQEGEHPKHQRRDRPRHRDDLPGFGAGHAAVDRPQPVPRPRADQGPALPQPHGPGAR